MGSWLGLSHVPIIWSRASTHVSFVTVNSGSLDYSRASLVAQLVKNPPVMWKTWVPSLGWEDSLEKGRLPTPVFWPGEFHGLYSPRGCKESHTSKRLSLFKPRPREPCVAQGLSEGRPCGRRRRRKLTGEAQHPPPPGCPCREGLPSGAGGPSGG